MGIRIQALSDLVINQIAAGEVIERPASVVKELVENALDAGATEIRVQIEAGGKDLIRISDNGCGMVPEDLEICHLRHTTSKLRSTEDLLKIATNGFRGEAVASIASVAKLRIESRVQELDVGHAIQLDGGVITGREVVARAAGTQFAVHDLFFNTPVRRTFLGSETLETAKISDIFTRIALAHPDKRFELKQGAREIFTSAAGTLRARVAEVIGNGVAKHMAAFDYSEGDIRVHGFACPPEETRGKRNLQYFFLGQRPIFNSVIAKAVQRAYEPYGKAGYPVVVLFLDMKGTDFDVNVHPAKREVRFSNENQVFLAVHHALRDTLMNAAETGVVALPGLGEAKATPVYDSPKPVTMSRVSMPEPPKWEPPPPRNPTHPLPQHMSQHFPQHDAAAVVQMSKPNSATSAPPKMAETQDLFSLPEYGKVIQLSPKLFQRPVESKAIKPDSVLSGRFFQWAKTYVVCEDSQGLLVIDQNAASQRILYDRAIMALDSGRGVDAQELLFPEVVELTRSEGILLQEHTESLSKLGFHVEPFGNGAWQLRGIPVHLPVGRAEVALRDFLAQLADPFAQGHTGPREALAKAYALGSAQLSGTTLSGEEMSALLDQLVLTSDPFMSPFGRPALLRLPLEEIHRRFKRGE